MELISLLTTDRVGMLKEFLLEIIRIPGLGLVLITVQHLFQVEAGPRFYTPGSYANLDQRTDFAGELIITRPVSDSVDLFAHWKLAYTGVKAEGWGKGCQHHVGAGVTFKL